MEIVSLTCVVPRRTALIGKLMAAFFAVLFVVCGFTPLMAQSPSFPDFSTATNSNLPTNGNAVVPFNVGTQQQPIWVLRLNPADYSQVGSAWFSTLQPVAGGFSTTFQFQITPPPQNPDGPTPPFPADGFAFVIQSAGTNAIGQAGGYLGYGSTIGQDPNLPGISNSVAIEFDTYANGWDVGIPNVEAANHIAVQSCAFAGNTVDHSMCNWGIATPPAGIILADGAPHTVRIDYVVPPVVVAAACNQCNTPNTLQVSIDSHPVFASPISIDLGTLISFLGPNEDSAYAGFTGATGALVENNDILNWTFTSHSGQSQTQPAPANQFTTFNFGSYLYKVKPNQSIAALTVEEVPIDPLSFNPGPNFRGAQCIVYDSTGGKCVEFHAICPASDPNCSNVSYDVATSYDVIGDPTSIANNGPGFLKASGQSCPPPDSNPFDANIITQFTTSRTDPTTKGSSKPSFSCFAAVQNVNYAKTDLDIINLAGIKVKPNTNLNYVSTVGNLGPSGAQGVAISNTIPSGTTYVSSALCTLNSGCSNTNCTFNGTVASCQVGNLDKYGIEFMVTTVKVTATSGYVTDTATVSAFNPDTDKVPDRTSTWKTLVSNR